MSKAASKGRDSTTEPRCPAIEERGPAIEERALAVEGRTLAIEGCCPAIEERALAVESCCPAIELRDLSFRYGKAAFIEALSARFETGVITSIVGPNGCGKSTLVRLMDGLLRPEAGAALIEGRPVLSLRPRRRARRLAVLAQGNHLPAMTVEELVACGRFPHQSYQKRLSKEDREQIEEALEETGIARFRKTDVRRLSGGERQRAFIAMTLAQNTGIILLDEPTTYLDIHACHEIMQLVRRLNRDTRKTFVMVIHDLDLALRYSDKLMVMEHGRSTFIGNTDDPQALSALEQAFSISVIPTQSTHGKAFSIFPGEWVH
ncbi:MAG: ABC transporter ATP-binding protein [Coriobacteriales bacterium]|jgi:iron complex transport system ATP-binding protein|nr:ABC transporter ATP-binding protein [Coriobacteriales bacterium]